MFRDIIPLTEGEILYKGESVIIKGNVADLTDTKCLACDNSLTNKLLMHNNHFMVCVVSCDSHPKEVFTHIYPKQNLGGTAWSYTYADRRFIKDSRNLSMNHEYSTSKSLDEKIDLLDKQLFGFGYI